jgi:hypothetical protein
MNTFEPVPVGFLDGSLGPEDMLFDEAKDPSEVTAKSALDAETPVDQKSGEGSNVQTFSDGVSAAREGNLAEVERLCTSGWRSNEADDKGCTALMWAAGGGHLDICGRSPRWHLCEL